MTEATASAHAPFLRAFGLTRHFGGLAAVQDVSLECRAGSIHALIGPNGAGKTTLINLLSGDLAPSGGRILIGGTDAAGLPAHRISRLGVGRSYQKSNVFLPFTVWENCRLAAQSRHQPSMRFLRNADGHAETRAAAERALLLVGLARRAAVVAGELSHGARRQLEIAMALATAPRLLLLDEPLAGLGAEESAMIIDLLARLRAEHAILLVEHDMDAVFALADILTVMVQGAVLASGPPQAMRANRAVQEAYIGTPEADDRV